MILQVHTNMQARRRHTGATPIWVHCQEIIGYMVTATRPPPAASRPPDWAGPQDGWDTVPADGQRTADGLWVHPVQALLWRSAAPGWVVLPQGGATPVVNGHWHNLPAGGATPVVPRGPTGPTGSRGPTGPTGPASYTSTANHGGLCKCSLCTAVRRIHGGVRP